LDLKQGISYLERGGGGREREKDRVRHKEREGDLIIKTTGNTVLPNYNKTSKPTFLDGFVMRYASLF
jgi:hypothetical protein